MSEAIDSWGQPTRFVLNEFEAFDALRVFLEAYWKRGGKSSKDIAVLLSNVNREVWADGRPFDPAQWSDWLKAVEEVKGRNKL